MPIAVGAGVGRGSSGTVAIIAAGLTAVIAAAVAAWWIRRRLQQMLAALSRLAEQSPEPRTGPRSADIELDETAAVADAMQAAFDRFGERLESILRVNSEQEAVLTGMAEGVIAVDAEKRVISVNRSAGKLIGLSPAEIIGRELHEVVRNPELLRFVERVIAARKPLEGDLVLRNADERVIQIRGTMLNDSQGRGFGAVLVLNDVSRLRQLENMRRDFAANVSHELKTPITSIKGFIETILDGATPEDADRFLRIVARQADRLDAIIDDLLSLSRIEKEAEAADIAMVPTRLKELLQGAANDCQVRAEERRITFQIDCPDDVIARANALLLQQAVRNLVENAVKYSEAGGVVRLTGRQTAEEIRIDVADDGCGIAPEHHARLFERFYRVDKARSRKLGGTGLGLAIVKHIVLAHRGRVTVASAPGKGSTFTIHLPPQSAAEPALKRA